MNPDHNPPEATSEDRRLREREQDYQSVPRSENGDSRGHDATSPRNIPARGWLDVAKRTGRQIDGDHLALISAGVAFFLLLGLFPGLAAIISMYGWLADPATAGSHIDQLSSMLPREAAAIIRDQVKQLASAETAAGWGAIIGLVLAVWAGSKAMKGMVEALNIAYHERESRGFIKQQLVYLSLTFISVVAGLFAILLIAVVPVVVNYLPLPEWGKQVLIWLRWPVLLFLGMTLITTIYRYGPSRRMAKWRWVSWGAGAATILWLITSALFSLYVSNFGNYNEVYGSLGAVVILMMWLYLTAFLVLMGAEIDCELELQTQRDTTEGEEKPMGSRGAFAADHVVREH